MRRPRALISIAGPAGVALLVACGHSAARPARAAPHAPTPFSAAPAATPAHWRSLRHVRGVVDLTAPAGDGTIVVAARGRLQTLSPTAGLKPFAPRYAAPPGLEPYLVRSLAKRVAGAGCAFPAGGLYALRLAGGNGVTAVSRGGTPHKLASLPHQGLEDGIAFDTTGRFGYRLLVTRTRAGRTTVTSVDCRGQVRVVTNRAPRVEGGLAVAPRGFGAFGGDLIAPNELSGKLYAIAPDGTSTLIADSGLPHGQDIGVESAGFVPAHFRDALVADRGTRRNRHLGDDEILALSQASLTAAGVRPGDLLVVAEGGAGTIAVRCRATCTVSHVATGPARAHIEGHVVFSGAF